MRTTNTTYTNIVSGSYFVEWKVIINGTQYGGGTNDDKLIDVHVSHQAFEKLMVGAAVARQFVCEIIPATGTTIPRGAGIVAHWRVSNGSSTSNWFKYGEFITSYRSTADKGLGVMRLTAYDRMRTAEGLIFMKSGTWTSQLASDVLDLIAADIDCGIASATSSYFLDNDFTVPNIPVIGTDGTTCQDMLKYFAAHFGGVFIVNWDNKLELKRFGSTQTLALDNRAEALEVGAALTVTKTIVWTSESSYYRAPAELTEAEWLALPGKIVEAEDPYADQSTADDLLTQMADVTYLPLDVSRAELDPAAELLDVLTIGGKTTVLTYYDMDAEGMASLAANDEDEQDDEAPVKDPITKRLAKSTGELRAQISVLDGEITAEVARATAAEQSDNLIVTPSDKTVHNGSQGFWLKENARKAVFGTYLTLEMEVKSNETCIVDTYFQDPSGNWVQGSPQTKFEVLQSNDYYPITVSIYQPPRDEEAGRIVIRSNGAVIDESATAVVDIRNERLTINATTYDAYTSLKQTTDGITGEVTNIQSVIDPSTGGVLYKNKLSTEFKQTAEYARITQIEGDINDHAAQQEQYIQYGNGTLTLGQSTNKASAELTNSSLTFNNANGVPKVIVAEDTTIPNLNCDTLQMGNFRWITRSNGHYSLKKV